MDAEGVLLCAFTAGAGVDASLLQDTTVKERIAAMAIAIVALKVDFFTFVFVFVVKNVWIVCHVVAGSPLLRGIAWFLVNV